MSDAKVKLSIVIPSYKDKFLHNTIAGILENFTGSYEIIPVIDGYELKKPIVNDPRVKPIVLENNSGMRNAINTGVRNSSGEYIMRTDEHCMFAPGFDKTILSKIEPNWIVTARRYFLDPYKWQVMEDKGFIDYEKLIIKVRDGKEQKFAGVAWYSRRRSRKKHKIDETMAMQGSCWVMSRCWWDRIIGRLQTTGYGPHYQDSIEMVFKTWRAGGKLMVNKNTWFAHKYLRFNRSHSYPRKKALMEWEYSLNLWKADYLRMRERWAQDGK